MARKQQFMRALAALQDVRKVMYVEPPVHAAELLLHPGRALATPEKRARWKRALSLKAEPLSSKLVLFTPLALFPFFYKLQWVHTLNLFFSFRVIRRVIENLGFCNCILWLYHPMDHPLLDWFHPRILSVFDWAEEWSKYFTDLSPKRRRDILNYERHIIENADIVFTVSEPLLEKALRHNPHSYELMDGAGNELFQVSGEIPEDIRSIPGPVIGYIGTIMERFDVELVALAVKELPECSFVFIGDVHTSRINISALQERKNCYFLGGKSYSELMAYMSRFDVCILPYKKNSINQPPTKIFDYLATGKPIVSAPFPESEKFKDYVRFASSNDDFVGAIKAALDENSEELNKARIRKAQANTWAHRAREIMETLSSCREGVSSSER
jgi:glycosyltransferase involved in cell wall biosynthesis